MMFTNKKSLKINSAEFWARERSMPMWWLTDAEHLMGSLSLILYRNKMFHLYYLNGSEEEVKMAGRNFFSKKESVFLYEKDVKEILREIDVMLGKYTKCDLKKLDSGELVREFNFSHGKLSAFSNLYTRTEALSTDMLKDAGLDFKKLADLRFELRKAASSSFTFSLEKY